MGGKESLLKGFILMSEVPKTDKDRPREKVMVKIFIVYK
tara:strand:- start:733 stop:849 length:117 start_codon:yes stop_codon:yes gene_type:complete